MLFFNVCVGLSVAECVCVFFFLTLQAERAAAKDRKLAGLTEEEKEQRAALVAAYGETDDGVIETKRDKV